MEALWNAGALSIREIQEAFPERDRLAYTTIQTTVYRLETKNALRRAKKIGNAHIFEAVVSRDAAQLTLDDVHEAEKNLRKLARKDNSFLSRTPDENEVKAAGDTGQYPIDPSGPSILTALREQLGLKLESTKGPVKILVIEHAEKPSEN